MNTQFESKNISRELLETIIALIGEKAVDNWRNKSTRDIVVLDNLMVRQYVIDPECRYSVCRKAIQPFCPEIYLQDSMIARRAEMIRLDRTSTRTALTEWAYKVAFIIYEGMTGNEGAVKQADELLHKPYNGEKRHMRQSCAVLFSMFEFIPELRNSDIYENVIYIGERNVVELLNKIIKLLSVRETSSDNNTAPGKIDWESEAERVRNELEEYRRLVEEADAEFEDKLEELKNQELSSFFAGLNNEKYNFLIDTAYTLLGKCKTLRRNGTALPYDIQGLPAFLDRMVKFLMDSGISPASKFRPGSELDLTLAEMEGCRFEPDPFREAPVGENERVHVMVYSAGWKYRDVDISRPVLYEHKN